MKGVVAVLMHLDGLSRYAFDVRGTDADIGKISVRHSRELVERAIIDCFSGVIFRIVGFGLLNAGPQALQWVCGKNVCKCHVFGLSFPMVESEPPRFVCFPITMFLRLHNAQCCKVDMQSSHDALWLRFGSKVKVGDNGDFGFKIVFA
jgi:hypothetical protein